MIFKIRKASRESIPEIRFPLKLIETDESKDFNHYEIEINSLEQLLFLIHQVDTAIIMQDDSIKIYDDYIE